MCVELVELQLPLALDDSDAGERNRRDDGSLTATDRAITPAWTYDSIRQAQLKHDRTAVTTRAMLGENLHSTDLLDHGTTNPRAA
jgi:hypothetical protein